MKYSLRKSFNYRRRKETHDDDHTYPRIDANGCSNSNLNLVKPVKKSKSFLQRRRRDSSSSPPPVSPDKIKSKVFEPRYDSHYNKDDDNDDPFFSTTNNRVRPLDRLTYQIRKSFRNTITRQRPRLESTNSNKRLICNTNNETQTQTPIFPLVSTGLTSPMTISTENDKIKGSSKRRKAPLAPSHMNQTIYVPIETSPEYEESDYLSSNDQQLDNNQHNIQKPNFNRSFRIRISLLLKKRPENEQHEDIDHENPNQKLTFSQRFDSLRRSFHIGNRNSTNKGKRSLLSNE